MSDKTILIIVAVVGGAVFLGMLALVLVPNRELPPVQTHFIGQGSRGGLLNNVIAGI